MECKHREAASRQREVWLRAVCTPRAGAFRRSASGQTQRQHSGAFALTSAKAGANLLLSYSGSGRGLDWQCKIDPTFRSSVDRGRGIRKRCSFRLEDCLCWYRQFNHSARVPEQERSGVFGYSEGGEGSMLACRYPGSKQAILGPLVETTLPANVSQELM